MKHKPLIIALAALPFVLLASVYVGLSRLIKDITSGDIDDVDWNDVDYEPDDWDEEWAKDVQFYYDDEDEWTSD